jgi:hypothetical protein
MFCLWGAIIKPNNKPIKECEIILPISFEYCSKGIKKLAPKTLNPILCEINNKELKSILPNNKNNNTAVLPLGFHGKFING